MSLTQRLRFQSFATLVCGDEERGEVAVSHWGDKSSVLLSVESFFDFVTLPAFSCEFFPSCPQLKGLLFLKEDFLIFLHLDLQWVCERGGGYAIELFRHGSDFYITIKDRRNRGCRSELSWKPRCWEAGLMFGDTCWWCLCTFPLFSR